MFPQKNPGRKSKNAFSSYWFFSVPTGFFFSAPGFFLLNVTDQKCHILVSIATLFLSFLQRKTFISMINSRTLMRIRKTLNQSPVTKLSHDSLKNTTTNTSAQHEPNKASFVFLHTKTRYFAALRTLFLSHFLIFFHWRICTFYETFMLRKLIHQVSIEPENISQL